MTKKRYNAFSFRRARCSALFLIPTIVWDDGRWVFHFLRWALVVKYHPRWVRQAWRRIDERQAAFERTACPRCGLRDQLYEQLAGDWTPHKDPISCERCDVVFDLYGARQ